MTIPSPGHAIRAAWTIALLLCLAGCAASLGPGYILNQQSLEIRYPAQTPGELRIRAAYRLKNTGTSELASLDVALPNDPTWGRRNLRVWVEGTEQGTEKADDSRASAARIVFRPAWPKGQARTLEIEYTLPIRSYGSNAGRAEFFFLEPDAFPWLLPPRGFFAAGGVWPEQTRVTAAVPTGFRVASSGRQERVRQSGGETLYSFRVRRTDPDLHVVAGRYVEQRIDAADGAVIFWTFHEVDGERARRAAARLAGTWKAYRAAFEPEAKKRRTPLVVETSEEIGRLHNRKREIAAGHFPGGARLNREAFAAGVDNQEVIELTEHELAHTWFGGQLIVRAEAGLLLGEAAADYAAIVAARARGGDELRQTRAALYREFEQMSGRIVETPLAKLGPADSGEKRDLAQKKGVLFFLALENQFGQDHVARALARLVAGFPGSRAAFGLVLEQAATSGAGIHDLRAAMEAETGKDLSEFFRVWLSQKGIPAEFRAQYK